MQAPAIATLPLLFLQGAFPGDVAAKSVVTAAELEAHVRALAADAMEGRATGTPGERRAGEYLAARLAAAGAAPAGDDGTFLQRVPLARWRVSAGPDLVLVGVDGQARTLRHGVDYDVAALGSAAGSLRLAVASSAEEVPAADRGVALFLDASWSRARRWLADAGSAEGAGFGAVLLRGSEDAGEPRALRTSARPEIVEEGGEDTEADPGATAGPPWLRVHGEALRAVRAGELASLELTLEFARERVEAHNVVGVIRGAGSMARPELAGQALVLSAHYDHLGVLSSAAEGQDRIYNGADDDASGCAAVLELAEAWRDRPPPARSIVLLLATGEELGLLGTRYYLDHPAVPLEDTVCNVNFEMIGRPDARVGGPGVLWITGFERSNLGSASDELGLSVLPDPRPEQRFFQRSDNYAFALRGVVAQTLSTYDLHADYHTVRDEVEALDFGHMESAVRTALVLVEAIAAGDVDPAWLPDGAPQPR